MNSREEDMAPELADRRDMKAEPPHQSMAELRARNAARTSVAIVEWLFDGPDWDIALLSCGHTMRVWKPFGHQHHIGTRLSCEECRNQKLKETP